MALPPIQGASGFFTGANSTYTNSTSGGVWSSGDATIVTVNATTGVATGVAAGNTQIIYTVGSDTAAINVQINASGFISNGFNPTQVLAALGNEILWPSQGTSNSGRYFTDFHPLCDETILQYLPNIGSSYSAFLSSLNNAVILDCVNSVYSRPTLIDQSKLVFNRSDIMLVTQPVANQIPEQFVGLKMQLSPGDYGIKVNNLMLFFTEDVTFPMYLYEDFTLPPTYKLTVTAKAYQQVIVPLQNNVYLNYLTNTNKGGIWYFGCYQGDLGTAQAIYYPITINTFHPVRCWSFSAPIYTDQLGQKNFQRNIVGANNLTYGFNLEIATMIDATNNIVSNPSLWGNMIGYKMVCRIIEMCKFSYRTNGVQQAIQALGGLDELNMQLNGKPYSREFGTAKVTGLIERVKEAARVVKQGFEPEYVGGVGLI